MNKNFISNLSAIKNMSLNEMTAFLDYVYTTGLNNGMYAAGLPDSSDEKNDILDECPYNEKWLSEEAEEATRCVFSEDGEAYIPEFFTKAILRIAGINTDSIKED